MVRNMAKPRKSTTPGHVVVYPNREKAASKVMKTIVVILFVASAVLMLLITFSGWSKLQGLKPLDIAWALIYLILAFYVGARWSRGGLTMGAGLGIMLLIIAVIAGGGLSGTSWFQRDSFGYAAPHGIFGGQWLGSTVIGTLTLLLIPLQALLIASAMLAFSQGWNIETEAPIEEARKRGYHVPPGASSEPAAA
jgi:hypothetical protein